MEYMDNFLSVLGELTDREYLIAVTRYHIAPILAGKKPASLIAFTLSGRNLYRLWHLHREEIFAAFAVKVLVIKDTGSTVSVLFYDESLLRRVLCRNENVMFLEEYGYGKNIELKGYLDKLRERFATFCPHEIGLFLGIPLEDVQGFMKNGGRDFILSGYWKVYSRPEAARRIFNSYDKARIDAINSIISDGIEKSL